MDDLFINIESIKEIKGVEFSIGGYGFKYVYFYRE